MKEGLGSPFPDKKKHPAIDRVLERGPPLQQ
jgi:hypothetical protein